MKNVFSIPRATRRVLAIPVGVVVVLSVMAADCGSSSTSSNSSDTPSAAASGAPAQPPKVLLKQGGSGTASTNTFTTGDEWTMAWTYNCASFGDEGNFVVDVYDKGGDIDFDNQGVNQLGKKGSGTEHYHTGGAFFLKVSSECSWSVTVTG